MDTRGTCDICNCNNIGCNALHPQMCELWHINIKFAAMNDSDTLPDGAAISDFALTLVHEIRNPLTNIDLSLQMLSQEIQDSDLRVYLDIIKRSSDRIGKILKDLVSHQKLNNAAGADHSLHSILDEVILLATDRIALKKVKVTRDYDSRDCVMMINAQKIKIALTNIVVNAIEAMDPREGELKLVTRSTDATHLIRIEDNGCGINDAGMKNLFKKGFSDKPGGIGIGLFSTLKILKSSNVDIDVQSQAGSGTCFILTFNKGVKPDKSTAT